VQDPLPESLWPRVSPRQGMAELQRTTAALYTAGCNQTTELEAVTTNVYSRPGLADAQVKGKQTCCLLLSPGMKFTNSSVLSPGRQSGRTAWGGTGTDAGMPECYPVWGQLFPMIRWKGTGRAASATALPEG